MRATSDFPFQVVGEQRRSALDRCLETIRGWGLTMPNVEPLVLDFGLDRFQEIGEIEFWVANEGGHGYCGKFLFVNDGQTCPYHRHAQKHETFFVMKGAVRMVIDGQERVVREAEIVVMAPGQQRSCTGLGPALLLEVSMPSVRQDSFFADRHIGEDGIL